MNQLISQRPNVQPRRLSFCAAVWITLVATCLTSNATHASGDKDSAEVAVKSVLQTVEHLRAAAERGEAGSMNQLGIAYAHGRGVQQDRKQAVEWYLKAAEKGNVTAMLNLGWAQLRGHGVARDDKQAVD